jgi:hypothetical protein
MVSLNVWVEGDTKADIARLLARVKELVDEGIERGYDEGPGGHFNFTVSEGEEG